MDVELRLSNKKDAHVIQNLWPLYQHDISEFDDGLVVNSHGVFDDEDSVSTLAVQASRQEPWWTEPGSLVPYLIVADGRPAGFNLIAAQSRVPKGIDADFVVHEFFVLHAFRKTGVAERAAVEGFNRHRGRWEVATHPADARAIAFWRRVICRHTTGADSQQEADHPWGRRVTFHFDNTTEARL